jgi:hypothetical protein
LNESKEEAERTKKAHIDTQQGATINESEEEANKTRKANVERERLSRNAGKVLR